MKKFLSLLLSCTICFATALTTGCRDGDSDSEQSSTEQPVQVVEKLEMDTSNIFLTLGDKAELTASYNEIAGEALTWSSSASDVVSVDGNGCIEALKVGKATITAAYGSKQVSREVEVSLSGNVPMLGFDSGVKEEITLLKGMTFDLGTCVQFNGNTFYDGEIEYYVADESIGTVTDGKFVAKNVAGSTEVSVFATWRGQTVHATAVSVKVIPETTVLLNGGRMNSVHLYTAAEHEGNAYATSQTISSVFVSEDGVEIGDYDLSVLDEGIASIEKVGEEWKLTAKKAGETNLLVSYGEKEFPFAVTVERPVAELDGAVNYSLADGKYFDGESQTLKVVEEMIDGFEDIVSYKFNGKEYKIKNGVLALSEGEDVEVTLYNESVGYKATFNVYTKVIDELEDFKAIYAGDTATDIKGLYMLGKDILEPETVLSMPAGKVPNNFAGTFDGKGHVLSFTLEHGTEHMFGLFGKFLKGATIKNIAFNNITKSGSAGKNPAGVICGEGSDGASTTGFSTVENVYLDVKFNSTGSSNLTFMGNAMWATIMKNVIIHVPEVPVHDTYGSFARGAAASVTGAYVISSAPLYKTVSETNFKVVPTLYADYETMKAAGNDYTSFSTEYWDVTTYGVPVWKTLVADFME